METERLPFGQSLSDKLRAAHYRWVGMPPGLTPELASKFVLGLHGGKTVKDMTDNGEHYICSLDRFRKHCNLNPEWGAEAKSLSTRNSSRKKSVGNWKVGKSFEFCMRGLHRMVGNNVMVGTAHKRSNRFCRACFQETMTRTLDAEEIAAVKHAILVEKRTIVSITTGTPMGGGPANYRAKIVSASRLAAHNKRDPEFGILILSNSKLNRPRSAEIRNTRIIVANVRQENNDYHSIRNLIPESNPHRDDIVARIFEDLLSGILKREDVRARVKAYIAELNKLYPTKYAKFGDSLLVSLDEAMFDDGSTTRGDTVSRGLWD